MATRRSKLRIVPPILKRAVTIGVIPACVVSAAACGKTLAPPVVAQMAPPVVAYMPPPVVAALPPAPPPPVPVPDADVSPTDAAAPRDAAAPKRDAAAASTAAPAKTIRAPVVAHMPPNDQRDKDRK